MKTGCKSVLRDRVSGAEELQAKYSGDAGAGGGGRGVVGDVGWCGGVRTRRARMEPRTRARQLYSYCFFNYKVIHVIINTHTLL